MSPCHCQGGSRRANCEQSVGTLSARSAKTVTLRNEDSATELSFELDSTTNLVVSAVVPQRDGRLASAFSVSF
jgi:hypothetical protein